MLAAFPSRRPFNNLRGAADNESVVLSLVRLFWIPRQVLLSGTVTVPNEAPFLFLRVIVWSLILIEDA